MKIQLNIISNNENTFYLILDKLKSLHLSHEPFQTGEEEGDTTGGNRRFITGAGRGHVAVNWPATRLTRTMI